MAFIECRLEGTRFSPVLEFLKERFFLLNFKELRPFSGWKWHNKVVGCMLFFSKTFRKGPVNATQSLCYSLLPCMAYKKQGMKRVLHLLDTL